MRPPTTFCTLAAITLSVAAADGYAQESLEDVTALALDARSEVDTFAETKLEIPMRGVTLALRDLTGDGELELVRIDAGGVHVRALDEEKTYSRVGTLLPWPNETIGWDLADLDGDGHTSLLMVADGRTISRVRFTKERGWAEPEALFEAGTYLPFGVAHVPFARDIDADGQLDLVLPGPGRFHVRLNRGTSAEGGLEWSNPVEVGYEPEIDYELGDPGRLSSTFGQSVVVPYFSMFDVDGDGTQDLVSEMDDRVAFHLARPEIDALPSWELDLSRLKNDVSASDIDLDDLLSVVSGFAQWRIADLDGEGANDLVIGSDGRFRVYFGGAATGPTKDPDVVRKIAGNALYFFVRDVIGDDRPDLQIVRGERISLARLLKYLVVPGKLDFDVFTYANENGVFARRPTKTTTLALRVPRLFQLFEEFEEVSDALEEQWDIPARRVDWDGDGEDDDVIDALDDTLVVYENCAPPKQKFEDLSLSRGIDGLVERVVLQDLDELDDGGESVIDLGSIDTFAVAPGKALRDATSGKKRVASFPLWSGKDDRAIRTRDLDGDGRLDVITVIEVERAYRIQILLRR